MNNEQLQRRVRQLEQQVEQLLRRVRMHDVHLDYLDDVTPTEDIERREAFNAKYEAAARSR